MFLELETFGVAKRGFVISTLTLHSRLRHVVRKGIFPLISVDCLQGYYYDRAGNNCELCAEGSYTAEPRQTQCVACPEGTTTTAPGSTFSEDCFGRAVHVCVHACMCVRVRGTCIRVCVCVCVEKA